MTKPRLTASIVTVGSLWRISDAYAPVRMNATESMTGEELMVFLYGVYTVVKLLKKKHHTEITLTCTRNCTLRTEVGYGAFIRDAMYTQLT
jgi:hypothetical protein